MLGMQMLTEIPIRVASKCGTLDSDELDSYFQIQRFYISG